MFTITPDGEFHEGWLAGLLAQPLDTTRSWVWQDGYRMALDTPPVVAVRQVLTAMGRVKQVVITTPATEAK